MLTRKYYSRGQINGLIGDTRDFEQSSGSRRDIYTMPVNGRRIYQATLDARRVSKELRTLHLTYCEYQVVRSQ